MVEYLEIQGKQYPVRIGYLVMKQVKAKTNLSFSEALQKAREENDLQIYETILYHSLRMGAYAENGSMDIPFKEEDMPMVLDLCLYDFLPLFKSDKFFPKERIKQMEEALDDEGGEKKPKATSKKKSKKT